MRIERVGEGGGLGDRHPCHEGLKGYGGRTSAVDAEPGQPTPVWAQVFTQWGHSHCLM